MDASGQQFLVGSGGWLQDESCLDLQEESRTGQQLEGGFVRDESLWGVQGYAGNGTIYRDAEPLTGWAVKSAKGRARTLDQTRAASCVCTLVSFQGLVN